jgi:hypothetical protein
MQSKKIINVTDPANNQDAATKKYVDDNAGGTPEGTAVLSTGEDNTKFLRADGDNSCSWQVPAGAGDVTAAANLTDEKIVQGDGGAKGIKTSTATIAQIESAVTHYGGDGSDHADVATNTTHSTGDGSDHADVATNSAARHTQGTDQKLDDGGANEITAANAKAAYTHSTDNTQAHSDYLINNGADETSGMLTTAGLTVNAIEVVGADGEVNKAAVEDSGNWDTAYGWGDWSGEGFLTAATVEAEVDHTNISNIGTNTHAQIDTAITASTNHIADNTQAHSDYLLNSAADVGVGLTLTGDNSSADTAYVPMVLYNTDDTPPAASGFPVGTLYVQYTA